MGDNNATKPEPLCGDEVVSCEVTTLSDGPGSDTAATVFAKSRVDVTVKHGNKCFKLNVSEKQLFHQGKKRSL